MPDIGGRTARERRRVAVAWILFGATIASFAIAVAPLVSVLGDGQSPNSAAFGLDAIGAIQALGLSLGIGGLGLLATIKQPANPTGTFLLLFALAEPWIAIGEMVADWVFVQGSAPVWVGYSLIPIAGLGIPAAFLSVNLFLLTFPTGGFLTRRWAWAARISLIGAVGLLVQLFNPRFYSSNLADHDFYYAPGATNPLGIEAVPRAAFDLVFEVGIPLVYAGFVLGLVSLVIRFFRSRGDERQQLKVVALGIVTFVLFAIVAANLNPLGGVFGWIWENNLLFLILFVFPAFAVALLKYRLYDFDVVINKALVYGSLVATIALVFTAIAFVPFLIAGADESDSAGRLALPFAATLVVVVLLQPARERLQKAANRVVYGRRATPYEALSEFSASVAESSADEELLDRMATILAEGTGAESARVWVLGDGWLRVAAVHPDSEERLAVPLEGPKLPHIEGESIVVGVVHKGDTLGALSLVKAAGDPVRPIERRLVEDLASQAGVVLRNFRLTEELLERLEQLQSSRQRLVKAQDQERRRLERNLHDGAQQQLVALKLKLGMLERQEDPERRAQLLTGLMEEADRAIDGLRDLARGIYPPMLAEEGLVKALRSQGAKAAVPVQVESVRVERYDQEVEAAVYFCVLEALQNVAKYAEASRASVILEGGNGKLEFEVVDDGRGFDASQVKRGAGLQNMEDRIEALGGSIEISSRPGSGTSIKAMIPTPVAVTKTLGSA